MIHTRAASISQKEAHLSKMTHPMKSIIEKIEPALLTFFSKFPQKKIKEKKQYKHKTCFNKEHDLSFRVLIYHQKPSDSCIENPYLPFQVLKAFKSSCIFSQ